MESIQRNSWWLLLAIAASFPVSGMFALASGATWEAVDVTGRTSDQIAAESSAGSELGDFGVRAGGLGLIALGIVLCAVLVFAYRRQRAWAWWAMWTLPMFVIGNAVLMRAYGAWGPATTATLVAAVAALTLLAGAPDFMSRPGRP